MGGKGGGREGRIRAEKISRPTKVGYGEQPMIIPIVYSKLFDRPREGGHRVGEWESGKRGKERKRPMQEGKLMR